MISDAGDSVSLLVIEKSDAEYFDSKNVVPSIKHLGQSYLEDSNEAQTVSLRKQIGNDRDEKQVTLIGMKLCVLHKDACKGYGLNITSDGDNKSSSIVSDVVLNGSAMQQGIKIGHRLVEVCHSIKITRTFYNLYFTSK